MTNLRAFLVWTLLSLAATLPVRAQTAAPALTELTLGNVIVKPRPDLKVTYTVFATQPLESKITGQKIRLERAESGLRDFTGDDGKSVRAQGNATRSISLNTGKHKTVAELCATVGAILRRFASAPGNRANVDLGKIGDAAHGGELHFIVQSADALSLDFTPVPAPAEKPTRFTRADADVFAKLLGK